jgi:dCMP deaminase
MEERNNFERIDKINYYLDIAEAVVARGTCIRNNYGCIIVKNDEIIATGYTGSPRGRKNCCDLGYCRRKMHNTPSGSGYDKCRSVHAEQNAIISSSRAKLFGSTLYLVGINKRNGLYVTDNEPCSICKRMIINAGIEKVIMRDTKEKYREVLVSYWIENDDTLD